MNAPLRRVAVAVFVLFALLFVNLNYVQVVKGDDYRTSDLNERVRISSYERPRGLIMVEDQAIAESVETDGRYKYQRKYPQGELYAHVTGYQSMIYGNSELEAKENEDLSGESDKLFVRRITDMITGKKSKGANVILTLDKEVQAATADALEGEKGAAIALDPKTGEILSLVSNPAYDPNPFASHTDQPQKDAWKKLNGDSVNKPLLDRALRQTYPPGSTFKVIMSAALVDRGYKADSQVDAPNQYTAPQTEKFIENFHGETCGNGVQVSLEFALQESCNTVFSKLGVEVVKAEGIKEKAKEFGFGDTNLEVPLDVAASQTGEIADPPAVAQSSIGQRDVRMTPLQGAMIAAAVANNGKLMTPFLVKKVEAADYTTLSTTREREYSSPLSDSNAAEVQKMMRAVVQNGTGKRAQVDGADVGGKTGTAEDGDERQDHAWFIGYAIVDGQPVAAVAVVLENAGTSSSSSAAIAGTIMKSIIEQRANR
ncbi:peptidoglycan D,D-transpeptidase FtsI family protein [Cryptosporangium arvum]|uniref:Cell division protein FtsI/penicillin-binding protein 2 n=1 Tax=Cryptosporangium arvum DSM 44712 TaxID=927661 RepID=A0A010ZP61_9ACTN|nr:penicillin-binding protein 2 [Cryptosporangium arvum]EXG79017.1 cell division protein FtsI/penicillin-binding protein 2 [Cryptosporangium arvum DSM 44712]